ncbi:MULTISPECIES: LysR family transcriptional regulator [Pseudoalteromonas]|uniref:LysR substrate-binding domain-containing protein n=1 Tax=Pseudoalteromonas TaxID=53246 RepID=UPI000F655A62|nr:MULTISPECIES: LysR family transcriptional regulator [Pseudoalteromonas]MDW7549466.1 LysR family transcriptional regulator [Pseudoalteromonas peptidolytica]RRS10712.1 LysR family transcriptional regulator [Pseudoalteromonas sp. J010]RXF01642.1 LysR family transcriptional regulator [Pseudoalteromonas sp. PS5]USD29111.1 LysR family transcriptional regulator [Pseudoalteromonas sp. SCSIO 43201]
MSRLNYHHLYYFWQVAKQGNLTQAAKDLHVSQSALSAQIKQLEHNSGVALFERSGRQLILTEQGKKVLSYADDIFTTGQELEALLSKGVQSTTHVTIGVLTTLSRNFVEAFITPLMERCDVQFKLKSGSISELLNGLTKHELDLVLTNRTVNLDTSDPYWQCQLVAKQPLAIVGPPQNKPDTLFPKGFANTRWILPPASSDLRTAFNALCAQHQFFPNILAEVDDMAMMRLLARDSGAVAVLPAVVVKDEIAQGVLTHYQDLPDIYEYFYAISTHKKVIPEAIKLLLHKARSDPEAF